VAIATQPLTPTVSVINQVSLTTPDWDVDGLTWELRTSIEDFLMMYNVDLYLSGHVHAYERMWPVYDEDIDYGQVNHTYTNPKYPVHIVSGAAGCVEAVPTPTDPV
jgi:hypothetical protein